MPDVRAIVLGCAQDGGVPQAGCACARCTEARMTPGYRDGRVACLGLVDEGSSNAFLIDATPDIAVQLWDLQQQSGSTKGLGLGGILLTHAHMGHYAGLLQLGKEGADAKGVPVFCTNRMSAFLHGNLPWRLLLERGNIVLRVISPNVEFKLSSNISITAVAVPHRSEISDMVAYVVAVGASRRQKLLYCPDTDTWDGWEASVTELCNSLEVAVLDGTFYSGDELPGRSMGEVPHPLVPDTVARLSGCRAQLVFTHLNHSNPLLTAGSAQRAELAAQGAEVATVGMSWAWRCDDTEEPVGIDGASRHNSVAIVSTNAGNAAGGNAPLPPIAGAAGQHHQQQQQAGGSSCSEAANGTSGGGSSSGGGGGGNHGSPYNCAGGAASREGGGQAAAGVGAPVVEWRAAVDQCSGDEAFLMELLMDLWCEGSKHMAELATTVPAGEAEVSGRIGHSIKGAAANLMCTPLRDAAFAMERVGIAAANSELRGQELQQELSNSLQRLRHEMKRFEMFLREKGVTLE